MGCDFCATTQTGFERNLSSGEIVEQFRHLRREAHATGRVLRTIVFMGMGEPMLNLKNVLAAIERIADPKLGAFGWRQITVSTVGIVPGIEELLEASLGVHLAIDDFGTGYSSLAYLKRFPVDVLKVDRSFVDGLGDDAEDTAIVTAVVSMSRALGLQVVAEGVETDRQLAELRRLGCDRAQGFLFSAARPADEFWAVADGLVVDVSS